MNHRMLMVGAALVCALGLALPLKAEKKTILVAQHTGVLVAGNNGYQVNPTGDIVEYSYNTDLGGLLTVVDYTFTRKTGKVTIGKIPAAYFPVDADGIAIVGLERNIALVLFTTAGGSRVYMTFNLRATEATPRPSKTNVQQRVALEAELCTISGAHIVSYRYADDTYAVLRSIRVYNHNWKVNANKGIDDKYGALATLNQPLQKHYVGVSPDPDPDRRIVSVLKP
jgi:hypothetical protein